MYCVLIIVHVAVAEMRFTIAMLCDDLIDNGVLIYIPQAKLNVEMSSAIGSVVCLSLSVNYESIN